MGLSVKLNCGPGSLVNSVLVSGETGPTRLTFLLHHDTEQTPPSLLRHPGHS